MEFSDTHHRPDYPPKTPPPPKKPISPFPPEPNPQTVSSAARRGVNMANRRGANWPLEAQPWAAAGARKRVARQLHAWGYRPDDTVGDVVALMVSSAVDDGGRRVSLHLADQQRQALVLVLSHQPSLAPPDDTLLPRIAELGATSCGTDTAPDGRRLWAVLDV